MNFQISNEHIRQIVAVIGTRRTHTLLRNFQPRATRFRRLLAILRLAILVTPNRSILHRRTHRTHRTNWRQGEDDIRVSTGNICTIFCCYIRFTNRLHLTSIVLVLACTSEFQVSFRRLHRQVLRATNSERHTARQGIRVQGLLHYRLKDQMGQHTDFTSSRFLYNRFQRLLLRIRVRAFNFTKDYAITSHRRFGIVLFARHDGDRHYFYNLSNIQMGNVNHCRFTDNVSRHRFCPDARAQVRTRHYARSNENHRRRVIRIANGSISYFVFHTFTRNTRRFNFRVRRRLSTPHPTRRTFTPTVHQNVIRTRTGIVRSSLLTVTLFKQLVRLQVNVRQGLRCTFIAPARRHRHTIEERHKRQFIVVRVITRFHPFLFFATRRHEGRVHILPRVVARFHRRHNVFNGPFRRSVTHTIRHNFNVYRTFVNVGVLYDNSF